MTTRYLSAVFARRQAPRAYDASWLNNELARLMRAMPTYVVRRVTANTALEVNDGMIVVDCTSGGVTVTIGAANLASGKPITIKKSDATANVVTIGGTVDGVLNRTLLAQNDSVVIQSDGAVWFRPMLTASATSVTTYGLSAGTHIVFTPSGAFDGSVAQTVSTDATSAATVSTIVARDSAGAAYLTLSTAAQPNITTVGTLAGLAVSLGGATPTNWLEYTQEFDAASWFRISASVAANSAVAPDSTTTADTLTATGSGGYIQQNTTAASTTRVTLSFYIKRLTTTAQTNFYLYNATTSAILIAAAAIWTGDAITSVTAAGGGGAATYAFTDEGNGWYRVSAYLTGTVTVGDVLAAQIYARSPGNTGSIYVWGAQLQAGPLTAYTPNGPVFTALSVTGNTSISGTLYVGSATTLNTTLGVTGATTLSSTVTLSALSASLPVVTNASKQLASATVTGTGTIIVMSASPTITGTANIAGITYQTALGSLTAYATPGAFTQTLSSQFASTVSGATLMGYGTTADVTLKNRAGNDALYVVANTKDVMITGQLVGGVMSPFLLMGA